jgi:hypothetical protein
MKDLASYEGIYAETASTVALGGIRRALARGLLAPEESRQSGIVGILTSHGLKNSLAQTGVFPPRHGSKGRGRRCEVPSKRGERWT